MKVVSVKQYFSFPYVTQYQNVDTNSQHRKVRANDFTQYIALCLSLRRSLESHIELTLLLLTGLISGVISQ